mmetsp:Transcript_102683/g.267974  ORF Transcript_102683/g.267974 Transcript_102683/m.267974 type:complete len:477 (+) Transcript_102683:174-1604(+)
MGPAAVGVWALALALWAPRGRGLGYRSAEEVTRIQQHDMATLPVGVEVVDAWYGSPTDASRRVNVTGMVRKQYRSGNLTVYALNELYGNVDPWKTKVLEVRFAHLPKVRAPAPRESPRGVTVLAQIGDPRYWEDLRSCMVNVSQAVQGAGEGFQIFLAFPDDVPGGHMESILGDARAQFGKQSVRSLVGEDRGADVGLYLRQLRVLGAEDPADHFDIFLKVHSESDRLHRRARLGDLCGSAAKVREIRRAMRDADDLGMVGPANEVLQYPRRTKDFAAWGEADIKGMLRAWRTMQPCVPFDVPLHRARVVAGSSFWSRQDAVLHQIILQAVDELLASMPLEYQVSTAGQTSRALERLIPTMVAAVRGLRVLGSDELPELRGEQARSADAEGLDDFEAPDDPSEAPDDSLAGAAPTIGDGAAPWEAADDEPLAGAPEWDAPLVAGDAPDAPEDEGPGDEAPWDVAPYDAAEGAPLAE